jgi:hypothetical protein
MRGRLLVDPTTLTLDLHAHTCVKQLEVSSSDSTVSTADDAASHSDHTRACSFVTDHRAQLMDRTNSTGIRSAIMTRHKRDDHTIAASQE